MRVIPHAWDFLINGKVFGWEGDSSLRSDRMIFQHDESWSGGNAKSHRAQTMEQVKKIRVHARKDEKESARLKKFVDQWVKIYMIEFVHI